jgi:hypothetical protein
MLGQTPRKLIQKPAILLCLPWRLGALVVNKDPGFSWFIHGQEGLILAGAGGFG